MSIPTNRSHERKRKKQKQRCRKDRPYLHRKEALVSFPEIVYSHDAHVPLPFVDAVKAGMRQFVINHEHLWPPAVVRVAHDARKHGFLSACGNLANEKREAGHKPPEGGLLKELYQLWTTPKDYILSTFRPTMVDSYLPYATFHIEVGRPGRHQMLVRMRAFRSAKTPGGTAYYLPSCPVVEIDGQKSTVAYFRHALQRICERVMGNARTCGDRGNTCHLLNADIHHELWHPSSDTFGVALFRGVKLDEEAREAISLLVGSVDLQKRYYLRVGYCPSFVSDRFLVAKTLLAPGMRGTPEFDRCVRRWSGSQRAEFDQDIVAFSDDGHMLKERRALHAFHVAGIPQVISIEDAQ